MKISGIVVLYNPILTEVISNIRSYIDFLEVLYVFDNSDYGNIHQRELESGFSKIKYFNLQENKGIAFALNYCAEIADKEGYEWALTMDQDSSFSLPDSFKNYLLSIQGKIDESVAFFSPLYPGERSGADQFYTSGSLINLHAWKMIGKFDEKLFIDEVDGDYTYRLCESNFILKKITSVLLIHKLGDIRSKTFFGKTFFSDNHSALRKYYIARNRVYLMKKRSKMRSIYLRDSFYKFVFFIIVESNKAFKMLMILKGIRDGFAGKMGKYRKV